MTSSTRIRLTQYAHGGGCACKIPPGELESMVAALGPVSLPGAAPLLIGLDTGDDAAVAELAPGLAVVVTADFFTPVVDDAYDWGRIAAANALSDVYAVGGRPVLAVNLLGWPREVLPMELAAEVLRGGLDVAGAAGCHVAGGHSIDDPEPKYGMAVTGVADPARLLRIDAGAAAVAVQAARRRRAEHLAQGDRRALRRGGRDDGRPEPGGERGGARRWHPLRHRRDRLRAARPPLQAGQGQRGERGRARRLSVLCG